MAAKQLSFGDEARENSRRGVDTLADMGPMLDQDCTLRIVALALEEPFRRIVANAADELSGVPNRVDDNPAQAFGDNAASIAGLILSTDCLIANAPAAPTAGSMPGGAAPEF